VLVGEIPAVLRGGLYAIPALLGAGIVAGAYRGGDHTIVFPIVGAVVCFVTRMAGLRYGLELPGSADVAIARRPRLRRHKSKSSNGED
ncbi:MAG: trimeric intracellular cation channel family protein, partial [Acidimicrobiales bacterium]